MRFLARWIRGFPQKKKNGYAFGVPFLIVLGTASVLSLAAASIYFFFARESTPPLKNGKGCSKDCRSAACFMMLPFFPRALPGLRPGAFGKVPCHSGNGTGFAQSKAPFRVPVDCARGISRIFIEHSLSSFALVFRSFFLGLRPLFVIL